MKCNFLLSIWSKCQAIKWTRLLVYSLNNYSCTSLVDGPEIYSAFLPESTKEEKDERYTIFFSVSEVSLWDCVNNSTVFIQLRTSYLSLPLFFLPLQSPACFIFLFLHLFMLLFVWGSSSAQRRLFLPVHHMNLPLGLQGGHVNLFTLV